MTPKEQLRCPICFKQGLDFNYDSFGTTVLCDHPEGCHVSMTFPAHIGEAENLIRYSESWRDRTSAELYRLKREVRA